MDYKVFYSWQSDLPNSTNRGFIQAALEKAAQTVARDETVGIAPLVDRDTMGVPGSPEIGATIFSKIEDSQAFVCDVSIINRGTSGRPTPNPNVMLELGYAAKALGWDRIVMVMNAEYGAIEDLPFDLRTRRVVPYVAREGEADRSAEKNKLTGIFDAALRALAHHAAPSPAAGGVVIQPKSLAESAIEAVETAAANQKLQVRRFMASFVQQLVQLAPDWNADGERDDLLMTASDATLPIVVEVGKVCSSVAAVGSVDNALEIFRGFEPILEQYDLPRGFSGNYNRSDFDFYKFVGHELFVMFVSSLIREGQWAVLAEVLEGSFSPDNIRAGSDNAVIDFTALSTNVELLELRKDRLKMLRLSLRADLLDTRHTEGALGEEYPMREFAEADFFLFTRGEITKKTASHWFSWIPWSILYLSATPRFLIDSERKEYAQRLLAAFGANGIEEVRRFLAERAPEIAKLYRNGFWDYPLQGFDPATLATR